MISQTKTRNKRKLETDNNGEPKTKRRKLSSLQNEFKCVANGHSPATQYTTNNILNDEDLFLDLNDVSPDGECSASSDSNSSMSSDVHPESEYTPDGNNKYRTPTMNRVTLFNHNRSSVSMSPLIIPSKSIVSTDDDDLDAIASIYRISENSLSILFKFLNFNDILQLSKTCSTFWRQSFKLLNHLAACCKTIYGVDNKQINRLISRCSFYLKSLDLSLTASIVNDSTVSVISDHCEQLTIVSLHGCINITDSAMILLLKRCVWIRELDISGCAQITSKIGEALALSANLTSLNLAWCTEIDCNIISYLIYLNENHSLRNVNLHCVNKFITLYPAFKCVLDAVAAQYSDEIDYKLKNKLFITGGLQQKTMNEENLVQHISYLAAKGIEYTNPETIHLRSISEYDFKYKLNLLLHSETISAEKYRCRPKNKRRGYRLYTVNNTDKIYMVTVTNNGVFGTKLLPNTDFSVARNDYMAALRQSGRDPIEYLKNDCDLDSWNWCDEFQSKRSLSLLGMHRSANWIKLTSLKHCRKINAFAKAQK